jgi:hypothetical protein
MQKELHTYDNTNKTYQHYTSSTFGMGDSGERSAPSNVFNQI